MDVGLVEGVIKLYCLHEYVRTPYSIGISLFGHNFFAPTKTNGERKESRLNSCSSL